MARKIGIIGMGNVGACGSSWGYCSGLRPIVMFLLILMRGKLKQMPRILRMPWPIWPTMQTSWLMIMKHLKMLMLSSQLLEIFSYSTMLVRTVLLNSHLP